jgi:Bacterial membrane protein YfhO
VCAVLVGNLWLLRATVEPVAYLDDASLHEQMVRYAVSSFKAGRNPLEGWFPYLGLGSPQFLHYQSLGSMVTGLFGLLVGGDNAFRWSFYLLLALWPLAIYLSAKIFRIGAWAAAGASVVAPLLASVPAVGYENGAYVWIGYGLWAQLWASWALPFAWATTWRAMQDRRFIGPAAICVALTVALHFETGYLALIAIPVFPWLTGTDLTKRLKRAGVTLALAATLCAWVLIPLLVFAKWAAINQVLLGTPLENGYGARRVLGWLISGRVFDDSRLPVVTLAVAIGGIVCIVGWRRNPTGRAVLVLGAISTLLCFGRTTFGSLVTVVPANHDLFFRRFMFGTQLAGIYLAGFGVVAAFGAITASAKWGIGAIRPTPARPVILTGVAACLCALGLLPALQSTDRFDGKNATAIQFQRSQQQTASAWIDPLVAYIKAHQGGRTYAGSPSNWGATFDVGSVPVFKYLESQDVDEVGYTLRTASLMTDPEYYFDESNPGDFALFGIRYLLYPANRTPPMPAVLVMSSHGYTLWTVTDGGYLDVVDTIGSIKANRGDVGSKSLLVLRSPLIEDHEDATVAWDGETAASATDPTFESESTPPGVVVAESAQPSYGTFRGEVQLNRRAVVLLSASYDPGWQVTVDGRRYPTEMLSPAVVGVTVGPGLHRIVFPYAGYRHYKLLFGLALIGLASALAVSRGIPSRRFKRPGGP